jgi:hypothetical protein
MEGTSSRLPPEYQAYARFESERHRAWHRSSRDWCVRIILFLFFVFFLNIVIERYCVITLDVATYGGGAGMKNGDILNKINDTKIKNAHQFYKFIASCKVGELLTVIVRFCFKADFPVQISFQRGLATMSSTLQVGARKHSMQEVLLVEHAMKGTSLKVSQDGLASVR